MNISCDDSNDRLLSEDTTSDARSRRWASEGESGCADRPADPVTTLKDEAPKITFVCDGPLVDPRGVQADRRTSTVEDHRSEPTDPTTRT